MAGSPTGFFRDKSGKVHPVFQSAGGVRHPMEKGDWLKSIGPEEKSSINMWTSDSTPFKQAAVGSYGDDKLTDDWRSALDTFNKVVDRAPTYNGNIYRGLHSLSESSFNGIVNAKTLSTKAPTSFSGSSGSMNYFSEPHYVTKNSHSVVFIAAKGKHNGGHIRPAQPRTDENEVVVPQGSVYHVDKVKVLGPNERGGKLARVYISHIPNAVEPRAVKLAGPTGFFRDEHGTVHPIKSDSPKGRTPHGIDMSSAKKLEDAGFECYLVGGSVRDTLLGRKPHDLDFTTNATPDEILKVFPKGIYTNKFGTVIVPQPEGAVEITTYRGEGAYSDHRHPDSVEFVGSLKEDLSRRDFTVNAMAMDSKGEIIDPFGGKADIEKKQIRAVGNPLDRFSEDPLRMLRAVRQSSQLGFSIDGKTAEGITTASPGLKLVSRERVRDELMKMLTSNPSAAVDGLQKTGLMKHVLPSVKGDAAPETLKNYNGTNPLVRLGALLVHSSPNETNDDLKGLKLSRPDETFVRNLTDNARNLPTGSSESDARRFVSNATNPLDVLDLKEAVSPKSVSEFRPKVQKVLDEKHPTAISDLAVNGDDLVKEMGWKPGPKVGRTLRSLLDTVIEDPKQNTKDKLLSLVKTGKVSMAAFEYPVLEFAGSPNGFFRDKSGKVHPIFTSQGGVRQPNNSPYGWNEDLTQDQKKAIKWWTEDADSMKKAANGENHNEAAKEALSHFNEALHTASPALATPFSPATIVRGLKNLSDDAFEKLTNAKVLHASSPTSFTRDDRSVDHRGQPVAGSWFLKGFVESRPGRNSAVLLSNNHNAGDISLASPYSHEAEVVVPMDSQYSVDSVHVRNRPEGGKHATIRISYNPKAKDDKETAQLAASGSPTGFFRDSHGKVHPIFTSQGGVRQPTANADEWKAGLKQNQRKAVSRWSLAVPNAEMKKEAVGKSHKNPDDRMHEYLVDTNAGNVPWGKRLSDFNEAIHSAPAAQGTIYRGLRGVSPSVFKKLSEADTLKSNSPTSFTTDKDSYYVHGNLNGMKNSHDVIISSSKHNAADIHALSEYPQENEAVVPQGSVYHVVDRKVETGPSGAKLLRLNVEHIPNASETKAVAMASVVTGRSKESVDFESPAKGLDHCIQCENFESPNSCLRVVGKVHPDDWCKLFEINKTQFAGPRYFTDSHGKVHPISTDREPSANADEWNGNLTDRQKKSLTDWTHNSTLIKSVMNGEWKPSDSIQSEYEDKGHAFEEALHTAPSFSGPITRGITRLTDEQFDSLLHAKTLKTNSPVSFDASDVIKNQDIHNRFLGSGGNSVVFVADKHNGGDISSKSVMTDMGEHELVVPTGSTYKVTKAEETPKRPQGSRFATLHISYEPKSDEKNTVRLASSGSPTGFFKDAHGKVHPIASSGSHHFDTQGLDLPAKGHEMLKEVETEINKLAAAYPEVTNLSHIALKPLKGRITAITEPHEGGHRIVFNSDRLANPEELQMDFTAGQWLPNRQGLTNHPKGSDTIAATAAHEFGHIVDAFISKQTGELEYTAKGRPLMAFSSSLYGNKRNGKPISEFAKISPTERFAENFSNSWMRQSHPEREYSPESKEQQNQTAAIHEALGRKAKFAGSPTGFFKDEHGQVHPIFQSPGGVRAPMPAKEWQESLTGDEKNGLYQWAGSASSIRAIASGWENMPTISGSAMYDPEYLGKQLNFLNQALHRAPSYDGPIYRGINTVSDKTFDKIIKAKTLRSVSPSSFSKSEKVADSFSVKGGETPDHNTVTFIATKHNGADIFGPIYDRGEKEVVVPQNSTYKVDKVEVSSKPTTVSPRRGQLGGGRHANVYISNIPGETSNGESVAMAGSPQGFFRDEQGKVHPIGGNTVGEQTPNGPRLTEFDDDDIVKARSMAKSLTPTWMIQTPERDAFRHKTVQEAYGTGAKNKNREAWLVIGPPGAGKSSLAGPEVVEKSGSLLVDPDEFKKKIPEYNGSNSFQVHEESSQLAHAMLKHAVEKGDNIVYSGTGKSWGSIRDLRDALAEHGYKSHLSLVDLPTEKAMGRAVERFHTSEDHRFTDPLFVKEVDGRPKNTYEAMKKEGGFVDYEAYSSDVPRGAKPSLLERFSPTGGNAPAGKRDLGVAGRPRHGTGNPVHQSGQTPALAFGSPDGFFRDKQGKVHPISHEEWKSGLSEGETNSLKDWFSSSSAGHAIKQAERGKNLTSKTLPLMRGFQSAVARAPDAEGSQYRGISNLTDDQFKDITKAKYLRSGNSLSFSPKPDIAEFFADRLPSKHGNNVVFEATNHNAKDISAAAELHQEEHESVIPADSRYRVDSVDIKPLMSKEDRKKYGNLQTGKVAHIKISYEPKAHWGEVSFASPTGFFKDAHGQTHPIFEPSGQRHPMDAKSWEKSLTDEQKQAIHDWSLGSSNKWFKTTAAKRPDESLQNGSYGAVDALHRAIDTAPVPHDGMDYQSDGKGFIVPVNTGSTIYRGMHDLSDKAFDKIVNSKTLIAASPVSFSIDAVMPRKWFGSNRNPTKNSIVFRSTDHNAADIHTMAAERYRHEGEAVVPQGSRYKVDKVDVTPAQYPESGPEKNRRYKGAHAEITISLERSGEHEDKPVSLAAKIT